MTQSAVSYQVRVLEERVGEPLLVRSPRSVRLTEAGRRLAAPTTEAFDLLRATWRPRDAEDRRLVVNAAPSIAIQWLAPRLSEFQVAHPDVSVRITIDTAVLDLSRGEADVAIRYGTGGWDGLAETPLFALDFAPMWTAEYEQRFGTISGPEDLADKPLHGGHDPAWQRWFRTQGVDRMGPQTPASVAFDDQTSEAHVALSGRAAVLLTPRFFRDDVRTGRLRQPFPAARLHAGQLWLVHLERRRKERRIRTFVEWCLAQARAD